jgi:hypothetical protein
MGVDKLMLYSALMNLVSFLFCGVFVVLAHTWHFQAGLVWVVQVLESAFLSVRGWSPDTERPDLLVGSGVWNFWNI